MCTPMLAGAPLPKFPGNQRIKYESSDSKWITVMKYYAEYLINLCVHWLDESFPSFERSAEGFCLLVHAWNSKSVLSLNVNVFVSCPTPCQKDIEVVITRPLLLRGANAMLIGGQR
jgi:hypothetical protein